MLRRFVSVFSIAAAIGLALLADRPLGAQPKSVITQPVNNNVLVTLTGNTVPLATQANDQGPVPASTPMNDMWLLLKRPAATQKAFEQYLEEQQNPKSPNYHKWLTPQQVGDQYGPAKQDIATVTQWLQASGFKVESVAPHGTLIDFSGTVSQITQAFHTQIHYFNVNGEQHYANVSNPQIPAALAPVVAGPVSLHNFMPHAMHAKKEAPLKPNYDANPTAYSIVPGDIDTIYNFTPAFNAGYTGTGVSIMVIEDTDVYTTADWGVFRKEFGLVRPFPNATFTQIHPSGVAGTCTDPGAINGDDAEAILDAEWATAAAPDAAIILGGCRNTNNFGGFIAMENLLDSGPVPEVISISWGYGEAGLPTTFNQYINNLYSYASSLGASVFVSSGDEGAAGGDIGNRYSVNGIEVSGYASTPYDVAVGGTDFGDVALNVPFSNYWNSTNGTYFNSALSYIQEIPWNNSCASLLIAQLNNYTQTYGSTGFCNSPGVLSGGRYLNIAAGSGGPSAIYAKPAFQNGFIGNPLDGWRDLPDVSLFAGSNIYNHTYVICYSNTSDNQFSGALCTGPPNTWSGSGGTSVAAPVMAGIMALVVQKNNSYEGNPLSRIYALASNNYGGSSLAQCNSSSGASVGAPCIYYDVTQGDNDVPCQGTLNCYMPNDGSQLGVLSTDNNSYQPAYPTGMGWDFATGIGSVNAFNFVMSY